MEIVKISSKYQVVIPKRIRQAMNLKAGQQMQVIAFGNRIEFIPQKEIKQMRGFLKGIDTNIEREADRL